MCVYVKDKDGKRMTGVETRGQVAYTQHKRKLKKNHNYRKGGREGGKVNDIAAQNFQEKNSCMLPPLAAKKTVENNIIGSLLFVLTS